MSERTAYAVVLAILLSWAVGFGVLGYLVNEAREQRERQWEETKALLMKRLNVISEQLRQGEAQP